MSYQPEVVSYDAGVYQLEITDPVDGGVGSVSNSPLLSLANRTAYLYQHVTNLENGTTIPPTVAPLNNANLTGTPTAPTPALGDSTTKISTTAFVQGTVNGLVSVNVAGGANVTLTAVQAGNGILVFTGALTANIAVIVPNTSKTMIVENLTSGAFTLTVKTAAGTGIAISQGKTQEVFCDGTNVLLSSSDFVNMALTGVPTAPTAAPGTNTTQISSTAFVTAAVAAVSSGYALLAGSSSQAFSVAPATAATNAVQFSQISGLAGQALNLVMSVAAASAMATLTADEIIVESALGGLRYCLASFSKTINLATTGAGGMDTGSAPVSGFVALYAIYNPTAATAALLAVNTTAAVAPSVYGGANMPSGFAASGLVSVLPTNASSQFPALYQYNRAVSAPGASVTTATAVSTLTSVSLASGIPKNAKNVSGQVGISTTSAGNGQVNMAATASGSPVQRQFAYSGTSAGALSAVTPFSKYPLITPQTIWWSALVASGTFNSASIGFTEYEF